MHRVDHQCTGHFYPRSPRGERPGCLPPPPKKQNDFYPRSPRGERLAYRYPELCAKQFLSTLPARGATGHAGCGLDMNSIFLSTLPARGATQTGRRQRQTYHISIHAPREGSDSAALVLYKLDKNFYPRSPRGERPQTGRRQRQTYHISIHAPREGSDAGRSNHPRACSGFLSTLPARGATPATPGCPATPGFTFLSTLPARGATRWGQPCPPERNNFYPRSPRGERPSPRRRSAARS